ncbi:hypothetical protein T492DRAFT_577921, partial [Pavlovales sp. CCMP2436]
ELRTSFRKYDANNSGSITKLEMRRALEAAGVKSTGEAVEVTFAKADGDGDGKISIAEYCELHERIAALGLTAAKLDELRASFRKYDANNSGSITKLEMRRALEAAGVKSTGEAVEVAFARADGDGDGKISIAEY